MKGHGTVPGGGQVISSLRPELGGLLAALVAVDCILSTQPKDPESIQVQENIPLCALIDNKAVISRVQKWSSQGIGNVLDPEYDLLQASKQLAEKHSMEVKPQHIKSHQDQENTFESLPWQAKLNCECDYLAEDCHQCLICQTTGHKHYSFPQGHGASISIDGVIVTAHMAKAIKEERFKKEVIEHIVTRAKWPDASTIHKIDWVAHQSASKRIPRNNKLSIFKLEFELFATMSRRHLFEKGITDTCPRCLQATETFDHVLRCPQTFNETIRAWEEVQPKLRSPRSCTAATQRLSEGIFAWLNMTTPITWNSPAPQENDTIGRLIHSAFLEQGSIGWGEALRGKLSKKWGAVHCQYIAERFQTESTQQQTWTSNCIFTLWRFCMDRWIARNEYVHGKTNEEKSAKENEKVDAAIQKWYGSYHTIIRQCDTHLFEIPLETRLQQPLDQKKLWLECVDVAKIGWEKCLDRSTHNNHTSATSNTTQPESSFPTPPTQIHEGRRPRVRFRRRQAPGS